MYTIKNGKVRYVDNIHVVKDNILKDVENVYSVVKGKLVLIWTSIRDLIAGVFTQGFWQNEESWNNEDAWKNEP
jgi:hypothetical protein